MNKTIEIKEIDIGENKISFKQSSKGLWFCDGFTIYCRNMYEGIAISEKTINDINDMLNNSEFNKAPNDFSIIMPNYSEQMAIYCVCGEVAEIKTVQICNWKNEFKFYLFEAEECKCGDQVYALSLMDESAEIPDELKDIFRS